MHIQVNTDSHIAGREEMATRVEAVVEEALSRFSDENSHKSGQSDKRCMMEARLENRRPTAVTHQAATLDQAISGAADKPRGPSRAPSGGCAISDPTASLRRKIDRAGEHQSVVRAMKALLLTVF